MLFGWLETTRPGQLTMTSFKGQKASTDIAECWALKTCLKPHLGSQVPDAEMPYNHLVIEEAAVER